MSNLDVTLDDRIKMSRTSRAGSRPSGPGPTRRFPNSSAGRAAPYSFSTARAPVAQWGYDMLAPAPAPAFPGLQFPIESETRLLISNLHTGVSDDDIKEIFSAVGDLKSYSVHYNRSGRSEGTAEVVFYRRLDAETAIKRFNNVQLDGLPMRIEIVGTSLPVAPLLPTPLLPLASHNRNVQFQGRGNASRRPQAGPHSMRKDHGSGRGRSEKISAEDLDADLEKYLAKSKETN